MDVKRRRQQKINEWTTSWPPFEMPQHNGHPTVEQNRDFKIQRRDDNNNVA